MTLEVEASFLVGHRNTVFVVGNDEIVVKVVVVCHAAAGDGGATFAFNAKGVVKVAFGKFVEGGEFLFFGVSWFLTEEIKEAKQRHGDDETKGDKTFADVIMVNGGFGIFGGFSFRLRRFFSSHA